LAAATPLIKSPGYDRKNTETTRAPRRVAYSFAEFAEFFGRHRTWVYRQVAMGRLKSITGYGAAMIPASELDRLVKEAGGRS
jgi:hypothetical protein